MCFILVEKLGIAADTQLETNLTPAEILQKKKVKIMWNIFIIKGFLKTPKYQCIEFEKHNNNKVENPVWSKKI